MKRIKTILVPTDFSKHSSYAVEFALALAQTYGAKIELVHSHGVPSLALMQYRGELTEEILTSLHDAAARRLLKTLETVTSRGVDGEMHLSDAPPHEAIADAATRLGADLTVMGTRGLTGLKHVLLGSTAERVVRIAPCPVVTVREGRDGPTPLRFTKILVPTDFSPGAQRALELAKDFASSAGPAEILVVHGYFVPAAIDAFLREKSEPRFGEFSRRMLREIQRITEALMKEGYSASFKLEQGNPDRVIANAARDEGVDLIVMVTHGRKGLSHALLGSVAERVLRLAPCPVVTVKPEESG